MIELEEAWKRIEARLAARSSETLGADDATGRHLAAELSASVDVPAHDVSAMDGYALTGPVEPGQRLPVRGVVAAGDPPGLELPAGSAARIMTGAPVPIGGDRVLEVEATDGGRHEVRVDATAVAGQHIRRQGEILRRGDAILPAGSLLTPGAMALLATHGHRQVDVWRAPTVSVLATGDEVVAPERTPKPGQLRDSHTDFLSAACATLGIRPTSLGISPDEIGELERRVADGLTADVFLLCGGVSMGEFDFVEEVLEKAGCELLFDAVAMQPGKPLVAAVHPRGIVFGLPGNPASVMVAFWLFVRPVLRRLLGAADRYWYGAIEATLDAPLPAAKGRSRFLPAAVDFRDGRVFARPVPPRGSHDVAAYARGTALVRVPAGGAALPAGASCQLLPLADWRGEDVR